MANASLKQIIPVFSFFLLLLSGWFIYSAIGFTKAIQTKAWPYTNGTVVSSEVKKVASKGNSMYAPDIKYNYEIQSVSFSSDRYSSTGARGSSQWANEISNKYQPGTAIRVYYNPANQKQSVLKTGLQYDNYWMTGLSACFLFVVSFAFIKQLKNRKANSYL